MFCFKIILLFLLLPLSSIAQNYWQQEVNYIINVELNDREHVLNGEISMEYINHSPDTLHEIYIHLWPNAYKDRSTELANQLYRNGDDELYFGNSDNRGFIDGLAFKIDNRTVEPTFPFKSPDICVLKLTQALLPKGRLNITTPFRVKIPSGEISRLGHIEQSYQITQWYPKPAVYDKNGWNPMSYLNQGEFYSEFGSFDVSITLPSNYIVGATGDLQTGSEIQRLKELADKTLKELPDIIAGRKSLNKRESPFPSSSEQKKTLRYTQKNIHDFAWFADKRYLVLKGEVELPHTGRIVETWAMFVPQNAKLWSRSIEYLNDGTFYYSKWNGDYPYNQVTAVDGTISAGGGMEYPNVTVIGNSSSDEELEIVIVHEVGHNWFYGILGSNERVHGWMDEGINTLNEVRYIQTKYPGNTRLSDMVLNGRFHMNDLDYHDMGDLSYRTISSFGIDQPIETHSADFSPVNYGIVMYQKTGLVFFYLKEYLGDDEFDRIMQKYFNEWKFKHPQPEDLKSLFESETGKNMDWFFKEIIQTTNHIDYKIKSVKNVKENNSSKVTIKNIGQVDGPIEINVIDLNGEMVESTWIEPGENSIAIETKSNQISKVIIDEGKNIPEINRQNNIWKAKGLFHKWEPIKFEFLFGDNEREYSNVFWTPSIAGNAYDRFMLGAAIHNFGIPTNGLQYLIAPHYSFGANRISGISEVSYNILPRTRAKMIKVGASIKSFANSTYDNSYFVGVSPFMRFDLGNRNKSSKLNQQILIRGIWRQDVYGGIKKSSAGVKSMYTLKGASGPDFSWNIESTLTYYQDIKGIESILRGEVQGVLSFRYLREMDKSISARCYFGRNFIFESPFYYNDHLQLAMSGSRGYQDLFIEQYNFERNASGGSFWAQQRANDQGAFSSTSDLGTTQYWLSSCNVSAQIPYIPNFIKVFSNHGFFMDGDQLNYMHNSGLSIEFGGVFGVYFPLVRSENMGNLFDAYGREIKFSLNFNLFDRGLNLSNLF